MGGVPVAYKQVHDCGADQVHVGERPKVTASRVVAGGVSVFWHTGEVCYKKTRETSRFVLTWI